VIFVCLVRVCSLGGEAKDYPHPDVDWTAFVAAVRAANNREQQVWNPITKRGGPWITAERLRGTNHGCLIL
jgi:hypothetical protein